MASIKFTIPGKGMLTGGKKVTIEADGFVGAACTATTERFIQALSATDIEEQEKPEMRATVDEDLYENNG